MSKKNKYIEYQEEIPEIRRPTIAFRVMNNCAPVPVAKPADFVQLTPIVQPVPIVPYSTQLQPLVQFLEDEEY